MLRRPPKDNVCFQNLYRDMNTRNKILVTARQTAKYKILIFGETIDKVKKISHLKIELSSYGNIWKAVLKYVHKQRGLRIGLSTKYCLKEPGYENIPIRAVLTDVRQRKAIARSY